MKEGIAACPFCGPDEDGEGGYQPFALDLGEDGRHEFRVNCAQCLVYGPASPTEAEAVAAWNKRPVVPAPLAGFANCPFCGGEVQLHVHHDTGTPDPIRTVECTTCRAWGGAAEDTVSEIRALWNRRRSA
jgi:hypothetical protein